MTAKIKLNAASGGGSISINAPSSAGSDTDLLDTSGNLSLTGNCKVGTITDTSGNNSSTTAQIAQGRAKVWCLYNGANNTVLDSFNTSSVTDNGTGDFTINFSTSFQMPIMLLVAQPQVQVMQMLLLLVVDLVVQLQVIKRHLHLGFR